MDCHVVGLYSTINHFSPINYQTKYTQIVMVLIAIIKNIC